MVDPHTPIVCFRLRKFSKALEFGNAMLAKGQLVEVIPDIRPRSQSGIVRMIINVTHTEEQLDQLVARVDEVYRRLEEG